MPYFSQFTLINPSVRAASQTTGQSADLLPAPASSAISTLRQFSARTAQ